MLHFFHVQIPRHPAYSPVHMKAGLQVHARIDTRSHMHTCAFICTEMQQQTLTHALKHRCFYISSQLALCPPHMLIHITCCSYITLLLTTHLNYIESCTQFLDRFGGCVLKNATSSFQESWILCSCLPEEDLWSLFYDCH